MKVTVEGPVGPAGNKFNVTTVWATVNRCIFGNIEEIWNAGSKKSCQPRSSDWVGHLRFLSFISSQVRQSFQSFGSWNAFENWQGLKLVSYIFFRAVGRGSGVHLCWPDILSVIMHGNTNLSMPEIWECLHMNICNCALCMYIADNIYLRTHYAMSTKEM